MAARRSAPTGWWNTSPPRAPNGSPCTAPAATSWTTGACRTPSEPGEAGDHWWPVPATAGDSSQPLLSWLEPTTPPSWQLVVSDPLTGDEALRVDLGEVGELPVHADFDGRFWVGTFADAEDPATGEWQPARIVAVDTIVRHPSADRRWLPSRSDRNDRPPRRPGSGDPIDDHAIDHHAPPTTTAAPTAPGQCDEYVFTDFAYPIRKCEQGFDVLLAQRMLAQRGYDIEADGFFGPATEQAVRQFQQAAGLEVDGLVGADTWAALYTDQPGAVDGDGNGVIDPWEVPADCIFEGEEVVCAGESADE